MAVVEVRGAVAGLADFELGGEPRTRPVTYTVTLPEGCSPQQPAAGLLFFIPGFGQDNDPAYATRLRQGIARKHGLGCVSVDYHAIAARPTQGCDILLEPDGLLLVRLLCHRHGLPFDEGNIMAALGALAPRLEAPVDIHAALAPPHGEYQNFGLLQALDHLVVLQHLFATQLPCNFDNVILVGSSHGGYIAHLAAKLAPNSVNAVIDNSAYVRAPFSYLGFYPEYHVTQGPLRLACSVVTRWQARAPEEPGYYGLAQQLVRDTAYPPHLAELRARAQRLPQYFCFNSATDPFISPIALKRFQAQALRAAGCACSLREITAADLDGKLWKTLEHGMDASLRALCDLVLPQVAPRPTTLDATLGTVLEYDGVDQLYRFEHGADGLRASVTQR